MPDGGEYLIRRADASDAGGLSRLAAATFPLACPPDIALSDLDDFIGDNLSPASFTHMLQDSGRTILAASDGDAMIGYSVLNFAESKDQRVHTALTIHPSAEINKFFVASEHHGHGVAALLMAATLNEASARGVHGVWLGVSAANSRANAFYRRHSFSVVGTKSFTLGTRVLPNDIVRERLLQQTNSF